jgi:hypothetical protein
MKWALAVVAVLFTVGVLGFSQITGITGDWSFTFRVLPGVGARSSVLNLKTTINGWEITSKTTFGDTNQSTTAVEFGFTEQAFGIKGAFGPFTIDAGMAFNAGVTVIRCYECEDGELTYTDYTVTPPAYKSAYLKTSLDFAGLNIGLDVKHWAYPYECPWPCGTQTGSHMLYTLTMGISPVNISVTMEDCCTGITFGKMLLTMSDVGLCCGITYDFELSFTKAGFEYARFNIDNFFDFCCGISFDLEVEFGVNYKTVSLTPKFAGFGQACVTIYADVIGWQQFEFAGLEIYGWTLKCTLGDCNSFEIGTVIATPDIDPKTCDYPAWYLPFYYYGNEYVKITFCGAGCCGGKYTVTVTAWFERDEGPDTLATAGGLFDLSSLRASATIPVMSNLNATISLVLPMQPGTVSPTLDLGWKFTF